MIAYLSNGAKHRKTQVRLTSLVGRDSPYHFGSKSQRLPRMKSALDNDINE
jgi:hypothetical protein